MSFAVSQAPRRHTALIQVHAQEAGKVCKAENDEMRKKPTIDLMAHAHGCRVYTHRIIKSMQCALSCQLLPTL